VFYAAFEEDLDEYERIKRGNIGEFINFHEIGRMLIAVRIASGLSQRELAERLQVDESQVSRWERNEYHGITIERTGDIVEAMHAKVTTTCEAPPEVHSAA
jgi:predicted transcriptional regulator